MIDEFLMNEIEKGNILKESFTKDKKEIKLFAQKHLKNRRNATRKKAEKISLQDLPMLLMRCENVQNLLLAVFRERR